MGINRIGKGRPVLAAQVRFDGNFFAVLENAADRIGHRRAIGVADEIERAHLRQIGARIAGVGGKLLVPLHQLAVALEHEKSSRQTLDDGTRKVFLVAKFGFGRLAGGDLVFEELFEPGKFRRQIGAARRGGRGVRGCRATLVARLEPRFQARLGECRQILQRLQFARRHFARNGIECRQDTEQFAARRENTAGRIKTDVRWPGDERMIAKAFVGERVGDHKYRRAARRGGKCGQIKAVLRCQHRDRQPGARLEPFAADAPCLGVAHAFLVGNRLARFKKRNRRHRRAQCFGCAACEVVERGFWRRIENIVARQAGKIGIQGAIGCVHLVASCRWLFPRFSARASQCGNLSEVRRPPVRDRTVVRVCAARGRYYRHCNVWPDLR